MSGHGDDERPPEQPIGDRLNALGITASIAEDELLAGAVVILRVIPAEGGERVSISGSDGLGWIERTGLLHAAHTLDAKGIADSRAPGA